jgi:hypothetical protein
MFLLSFNNSRIRRINFFREREILLVLMKLRICLIRNFRKSLIQIILFQDVIKLNIAEKD